MEDDSAKGESSRLPRLLEKGRGGDAGAYAEFLRLIAVRARRHFLHRVPDADAAEDYTQEVLLSVHRAIHTYDSSRPFLPWLGAILHHRYVDFVRAYVRAERYHTKSADLSEVAAPQESPHLHRLTTLEQAMAKLPERQRAAVTLTQLQGLSVRDAAKQLRMSEVAVRVSVHRARRALQQILLDLGYEDG